jgi:Fur family iron response transcriptional regulator
MSIADLRTRLQQHGIAPTTQRLEVAEILLQKPQHLAADQILAILRRKDSSVSKATVYNTLHLFGEKGLVRELHVDSSRTFYDSTTHPHHHFYHMETGELSDIPANQVHVMNLPPLPAGTQQDSVEVLIKIRDKKT